MKSEAYHPAHRDFVNKRHECIEWPGRVNSNGYGLYTKGRHGVPTWVNKRAHVYVYEECFGPVPDGLEVDHLCENKVCVSPYHLEAVTHRENLQRSSVGPTARCRDTHCAQGHEYTPGNTITTRGGKGQRCRTCNNERKRETADRMRADPVAHAAYKADQKRRHLERTGRA